MENNQHQILSGITVKSLKVGGLLRELEHGILISCAAQTRPEGSKVMVSGVLA